MTDKAENFGEISQQIQTAIREKGGNLPPQAAQFIEQALMRIQTENVSVKEALEFSPELIEEIYEHGYHLFQSGKFQQALSVFNILRQLDGTDPRFTFAIAACHHQAKNYMEAAGNYMLYEVLDPHNPIPYYHLYDCFKNMDQLLLAESVLQIAHRLAEQSPQHAELKGKIEMELVHLKTLKG